MRLRGLSRPPVLLGTLQMLCSCGSLEFLTITLTDGGEQKDIHPRYKEIPAERFVARVLAEVYGKAGVSHGPVFKSWEVQDGKAVLLFDSVGVGLEARSITLDGHPLSADTLTGF